MLGIGVKRLRVAALQLIQHVVITHNAFWAEPRIVYLSQKEDAVKNLLCQNTFKKHYVYKYTDTAMHYVKTKTKTNRLQKIINPSDVLRPQTLKDVLDSVPPFPL